MALAAGGKAGPFSRGSLSSLLFVSDAAGRFFRSRRSGGQEPQAVSSWPRVLPRALLFLTRRVVPNDGRLPPARDGFLTEIFFDALLGNRPSTASLI